MAKKHFIVFLILFLGFYTSYSQTDISFFNQRYQIQPVDSGKIYLKINNTNFFKNNEYFGQVADGFTAIGFHVTPQIEYILSPKLEISGGVHLLKYSGRDDLTKAIPVIGIKYAPIKNLNIILGNIYGSTNHGIIEPMFEFERYLNNNIENGLQFLWDSKNIHADLWLDWEQFILQGDPFQEKFNVGLSSQLTWLKFADKADFTLDFQNIVRHEGGQVNTNESYIKTLFNNATGLGFKFYLNSRFINTIKLTPYYLSYQDLSPTKQQMYIDGNAFYTTLEFLSKNYNLFVGYWYSEQYITPLGNPLFESISRTRWWVDNPVREILMAKISYQKNIYKGVDLSFRVETYSNLLNGNTDYSYGLIITFNERFLIR